MASVDWLLRKTSIEEAEAAHPGFADERAHRWPELARPFGLASRRWEKLKARMQAGDELWTFRSPEASWRNLAGSAGVALVRDGVVIDEVVTKRT